MPTAHTNLKANETLPPVQNADGTWTRSIKFQGLVGERLANLLYPLSRGEHDGDRLIYNANDLLSFIATYVDEEWGQSEGHEITLSITRKVTK